MLYRDTERFLKMRFGSRTAGDLAERCAAALAPGVHGDLPRWRAALEALPETAPGWHVDRGVLVAGGIADDSPEEALRELVPWRKGPLRLGGVAIETEWRSDWKWDRIASHISLDGGTVLDVGAGNGYFGWRMLDAGAGCVIGCDPTLVFSRQYAAIRHFAGPSPNHLLPLRLEDLPPALSGFDTVFSLGVLYHRRNPITHLQDLHGRLHSGGSLVLETLIIDNGDDEVIVPEGRYARMRNVHALPSPIRLLNWLEHAGFRDAAVMDMTWTTTEEQRTTGWMPFHSLREALDQGDPRLTVEGLQAPLRAVVIAEK